MFAADILGTQNLLPGLEIQLGKPLIQKRGKETLANQVADHLERKVVVNAGILITSSDRQTEVLNKVADCLADAVGLNVDFSALGL